jgi:hypothetical protein
MGSLSIDQRDIDKQSIAPFVCLVEYWRGKRSKAERPLLAGLTRRHESSVRTLPHTARRKIHCEARHYMSGLQTVFPRTHS